MTQDITTTTKEPRYLFIDGTRGIAAVVVLVGHLGVGLLSSTSRVFAPSTLGLFADGQIAVSLFFFLSGFALSIASIQRSDAQAITAHAIRRYPRLLIPIAVSSLLIYLLMCCGLYFHRQVWNIAPTQCYWFADCNNFEATIAGLIKFSFYDVFFEYNKATSWNNVLWTMHIELAGSFIIYTLISLFLRTKSFMFITTGLCIFFAANESSYYLFLAGMMAAYFFVHYKGLFNRRRSIYLAIAVGIIAGTYSCLSQRTEHYFLMKSVFERAGWKTQLIALAIGLASIVPPQLRSILECDAFKRLGRISFPLYLTHVPVIYSFSCYLFIHLPVYVNSTLLRTGIIFTSSVTVCLIVAYLFLPVERLAIRFSRIISDCIV